MIKPTTAALCLLAGPAAAGLAQDYPGAWRTDAPAPIVKALASNQVKGCGQFAYRQRANGSGEYLVYCSRDGRTWSAWLVWTQTGKVLGPYEPDPGLANP